MTKYELCFVVSAKVEDEERLAAVERAKSLITRFGGTVTNVDEWGKKRRFLLLHPVRSTNKCSS